MKEVDLSKLTETQKQALLADLKKIENAEKFNRLALYKPYPFQRDFHDLRNVWRMLMAPNRSGKTYGAAAEVAMHLTGRYPEDWTGKRFDRPIAAWVIGTSYDQMKAACHALLMGESEVGTGLIPLDAFADFNTKPGVPGMYANIKIKHISGRGLSTLEFKAYNQGRNALQGAALDVAWCDEEPTLQEQEAGIMSEIVTRLNDRKGLLLITYTPLEGETPLTLDFFPEPRDDLRGIVQRGARDLPHMANEVERLQKQYKPHEWRARIDGLPALGEGAIFPFLENQYVIAGVPLPSHTRWIMGMDYGINHPTAMALVAWVQDTDTIYVVSEFREAGVLPPIAASWSKRIMPGVRHAWPHDMSSREKGTGKTGQLYYKDEGLNMCPEHAQYPDERKNGLEDSIDDIYKRIETGRFKVHSTCTKLISEIGKFHRKQHKVVPVEDDLIAAVRYALMSLRYSSTAERIGYRNISKPKSDNGSPRPWFWPDETDR